MKVLFLGPSHSYVIAFLKESGEDVISLDTKLELDEIAKISPDFIISFGYRHIIKSPILVTFPKRIINLHVSYLPWNRGADPNFWSFVENTPKGVTIHYVDAQIDTGEIIAQKEVLFSENETLKTSYEKLQLEIFNLLKENWPKIKEGNSKSTPQVGKGSYHKAKDRGELAFLTSKLGYDTPVSALQTYSIKHRNIASSEQSSPANKVRKFSLPIVIFIFSIILLDRAILWGGDKLLMSPFWSDQVIYGIAFKPPKNVYVVGTCRATLLFDSDILGQITENTFYNAGRFVYGIGNMDFTVNAILSHLRPKSIIFVLDSEIIPENREEAKDAIEHRVEWWSVLSEERKKILTQRYGYSAPLVESGLWKFRGLGQELVKAAIRHARGQPDPSKDGYKPNPSPSLFAVRHGLIPLVKTLAPNDFVLSTLNNLIDDALSNGVKPILVVPPMHQSYATSDVKRKMVELVKDISTKKKVPFLNYLTFEKITTDDQFWTDPTHMNKGGAELFSKLIGTDLKRLLN